MFEEALENAVIRIFDMTKSLFISISYDTLEELYFLFHISSKVIVVVFDRIYYKLFDILTMKEKIWKVIFMTNYVVIYDVASEKWTIIEYQCSLSQSV